jgi:hypothetical protein
MAAPKLLPCSIYVYAHSSAPSNFSCSQQVRYLCQIFMALRFLAPARDFKLRCPRAQNPARFIFMAARIVKGHYILWRSAPANQSRH